MPTKDEFQTAIFTGLTNACEDAYHFTGEVNSKIRPEYIVTVNVAKGLFTINGRQSGYGYEFILKFEEDTPTFAMACVPQMIADNIFNMKTRGFQDTDRSGKIDICVYDQSGDKPICPIEVKGFCPSKAEVVKDLERNLQLLELIDKETGASTLEFAFLAALEEHKNCLTEKNIDTGLAKVKAKYEKRLKTFKGKLKDIELTVTTKTVAKNLIAAGTSFAGMDDMDIADRVAETYHFVGVIMTLEKKKSSS